MNELKKKRQEKKSRQSAKPSQDVSEPKNGEVKKIRGKETKMLMAMSEEDKCTKDNPPCTLKSEEIRILVA